MMQRSVSLTVLTVSLAAVLLTACSPVAAMPAGVAASENLTMHTANARSESVASLAPSRTRNASIGVLDASEVEGLLYMREEEKLAHDVYTVLYERWGLPIFQNIARSEQRHTDAVKTLLDRYGLTDPAQGQEFGQFSNPELQALYDELIRTGGESLESALRVGAAVEEIDLLDLEERIAQTDRADIERVYENLSKGSENHLRSFVSTLEAQVGVTYVPQHLSPAAYDRIVDTAVAATGCGRGRGRR